MSVMSNRGEAEGRSSADILADALDLKQTEQVMNESLRKATPSPTSPTGGKQKYNI